MDEEGFPEIELKYGLSGLIQYSPAQEMNRRENEIIYQIMRLIYEEERCYTSAKYLSKALTDLGYPKSKKSVLPYIGLMMDMGIVEASDNSLKPYTIIQSKEKLQEMMNAFFSDNLADSQISSTYNQDLHDSVNDRRNATNGF